MTWRWPSTAETCRHRLTNKYDRTTVVFWRTHPPSFTSHEKTGKENQKLRNESLIRWQTVWHFRHIMTCLSNLLLYVESSDPFLGAILTLARSVELHYAYLTVTRLQAW